MHTLFAFWTLGFAVVAGGAALWLCGGGARHGKRCLAGIAHPLAGTDHPWRRAAPWLALGLPLLSLSTVVAGLHHFAGRLCFVASPTWDYLLGAALPVVMALTACGAVLFGLVRFALMARTSRRAAIAAGPALQGQVNRLAAKMGVVPPRVGLCPLQRPLAFTWGLRRPSIVLSTWMVAHLDELEVEAVLAHELAHVARRDAWSIWLATVLRDAFLYLPTGWIALQRLRREQEPASDALAARTTHQPLALASALAKVWAHSLGAYGPPAFTAGPALIGSGAWSGDLERRIERLMEVTAAGATSRLEGVMPVLVPGAPHLLALLGFVVLGGLASLGVAAILAGMGCGPGALLAVTWELA